jgi:tellurite resistance protein
MTEYYEISDSESVVAKLVVDSKHQVWEAAQYAEVIKKQDEKIIKTLGSDFLSSLEKLEYRSIISVKISSAVDRNMLSDLKSKGFNIIRSTADYDSQEIVAEIPQYMVFELAKNSDVTGIEQYTATEKTNECLKRQFH